MAETYRSLAYEPPSDGFINCSQLMDFFKCRYRWELNNVRKIARRSSARAIDIGSAVHAGMAAAFRLYSTIGNKPLTNKGIARINKAGRMAIYQWLTDTLNSRGGIELLSDEELEQYQEVEHHGVGIFDKAIKDINLSRFRVVRLNGKPLIERGLQCKIKGWTGFHGTLDLVVKEVATNQIWILDYKVRKQFTDEDSEDINLQMAAYQHLLHENGITTEGTIMYQIKSVAPKIPALNQNGTVSRAKISTDWETYRNFLLHVGEDPEEYMEMQTKLDTEFHRETRTYRSLKYVEQFWRQIIQPMAELMARSKSKKNFRFPHFMNCRGCWAREFCLTELRGGDLEFLLQTEFIDIEKPSERLILSPYDVSFTD